MYDANAASATVCILSAPFPNSPELHRHQAEFGRDNFGVRVTEGPYIKDVRKIFGIFNPPSPFVRISHNLSVLFVRKIWQFSNPPSPPQCGRPLCMVPNDVCTGRCYPKSR